MSSNLSQTLNVAELSITNHETEASDDAIGKGNLETKESVSKPISDEPNVEDEVVAILLSAMIGSIIESWDLKNFVPSEQIFEQPSECSSETTIENESTISFNDIRQMMSASILSQKRTSMSYRTQQDTVTLNQNYNEEQVPIPSAHSLYSSVYSLQTNMLSKDEESMDPGSSIVEEQETTHGIHRLKELLLSDKDKIYGWDFLETNPEVIINFKQGNRYEGKLVNCRMHGKGRFSWADGSVYEGDFYKGEITGLGKIEWPDLTWYEGEMVQGYRHGLGLYVKSPSFYAGYWKCGQRSGLGAMYYDQFNSGKHYYNGEWYRDCKHGTGLRSYPSGAMYSGQWSNGTRHGLGTMVWKNNDIYSGNWEYGRMNGYGEYTWDTFFNRQLVVPEENCYYGNWVKNVRHGNGTLETNAGVIVRGTWKKGKKHGPAEVICSNGSFLYSKDMFNQDYLCLNPENDFEKDSLMSPSGEYMSRYQLPVTGASHAIDLRIYLERLADQNINCKENGQQSENENNEKGNNNRTFSAGRSFYLHENKCGLGEEEELLRNILMQFLSTLKVIYNAYAQLCCEVKPKFSSILMRLMWWQLMRDCNLHTKGQSLADFDILIANNRATLVQGMHYPFERFYFWQFLHCLLEVSWELYGKTCNGTPSMKGVLASALHKLLTKDIIPHAGRHKGNALFGCRNLLSLDSLYWYYRGIGEPHSARTFLRNAVSQPKDDSSQASVAAYQEHQIRGKNIIGVGGKLTYFPEEDPLLPGKPHPHDPNHPRNLYCLSDIGLVAILECILKVCPSISEDNLLVNIDYKLVFLEFYEILLLCAREKAKGIIERRRREEVKSQETNAVSGEPVPDTQAEDLATEPVPEPTENVKSKKKSSAGKKGKNKQALKGKK